MKNNQLQRKAMSIYGNVQTLINIDIRDSKQFIRGHNANINIHKRFPRPGGYKLQAAGCKLQATGYRRGASGPLGASGYKPGATGGRLQATSCKLQATSIMCGVGARIISV